MAFGFKLLLNYWSINMRVLYPSFGGEKNNIQGQISDLGTSWFLTEPGRMGFQCHIFQDKVFFQRGST